MSSSDLLRLLATQTSTNKVSRLFLIRTRCSRSLPAFRFVHQHVISCYSILTEPISQVEVPCTYYHLDPSGLQQVPRASCLAVDASSFPLSQCQAVVDYPVYVPDGSSIASLDSAGSFSLSLSQSSALPHDTIELIRMLATWVASELVGLALLGVVGDSCSRALLSFSCSVVFRPCVFVPVTAGAQGSSRMP